jgi:hypothetical protein
MATENGTAAPPEPAPKVASPQTASPQPVPPKPIEPEKLQFIRIYKHSNFFYWWIVWGYGFVCALFTRLYGHRVGELFDGKELYVFPSAWLGISFVALLLIVTFFTNYRVKGSNSFIMILAIALLSFIMYYLGLWEVVFSIFPSLLIYMNLAFYVSISSALLLMWLLATFGLDSLTYWEFTPGQVTRRHWLSEGSESYDTHGLHIDRIADDILINKILGLRFLGYGTADLKMTTTGAVRETFTIENVWNANLRDEQIRELVVIRPNVAA